MTTTNYDWLQVEYDAFRDVPFGHARSELRLAEEAFSADLPDDLLLKLHVFVIRRSNENAIWEVIVQQTEHELLARMKGGPDDRPPKYNGGFDPPYYDRALAAVRDEELPSGYLISVYLLAYSNAGSAGFDEDDARNQEGWAKVLALSRQRIIGRMQASRDAV